MTKKFSMLAKTVASMEGAWSQSRGISNPFAALPLPEGQYVCRILGAEEKRMTEKGASTYTQISFKVGFLGALDGQTEAISADGKSINIAGCSADIRFAIKASAKLTIQEALNRLKFFVEMFLDINSIAESQEELESDPKQFYCTLDQAIAWIAARKHFIACNVKKSGEFTNVNPQGLLDVNDVNQLFPHLEVTEISDAEAWDEIGMEEESEEESEAPDAIEATEEEKWRNQVTQMTRTELKAKIVEISPQSTFKKSQTDDDLKELLLSLTITEETEEETEEEVAEEETEEEVAEEEELPFDPTPPKATPVGPIRTGKPIRK